MRVLVVEDDPDLGRQLSEALSQAGYAVDLAPDGEEGHFLGETEPYDAAVLDLGLPKMDGVRVLEKWRTSGKDMPVLILTARDRWSEKVAGFDAGARVSFSRGCHLSAVSDSNDGGGLGANFAGARSRSFLSCSACAGSAARFFHSYGSVSMS